MGCAVLALAVMVVVAPAQTRAQRLPPAPEASTSWSAKALAVAPHAMVAAANPYAVDAGLEILQAGGSAVDAAIAVQLVLGLVEPQSSGLGGGAFLAYWDEASGAVHTYDGRETAPAAAQPDRFVKDGRLMAFGQAVRSGRSVGVPGVPRLLALAHVRHGRLPWARLFEPAIKLADSGFQVSSRLFVQLGLWGPGAFAPAARSYFFTDAGYPRPLGSTLANPAYAATLRTLAAAGADAFYRGAIAQAIVDAVAQAPDSKADMTIDDLARYRAIEREPVCFAYRHKRLCGMGPPSSGALTIGETLRLLDGFDLGHGPGAARGASAMHLVAEAEKLAYADRDRYIGDPDRVPVPLGMLDDGYIAQRRKLINPLAAMARPVAGVPPGIGQRALGEDATVEAAGTSHFSIVDADGNAVAMTTTVEQAFGSRNWAAGFMLNNQLTDFNLRPGDGRSPLAANAVEGGKRPRSSMAPTLVFDADGRFEAALGSVGGSAIIYYVAKTLVALIDWQMDPAAAAALVNFGSRGSAFEVDLGWDAVPTALKMRPFGHRLAFPLPISGTHIVMRRNGQLEGGADPRREGVAKGY